jgi:hypothetical protein
VHNLYFGNYYDQQRGRDEKVKNASLGPFKGWSVSLNNIIEREKVGHLSLKEAKDFAMENYINTEGLYRFWSAVVFKDNRQLPSYEEFSQIKGFQIFQSLKRAMSNSQYTKV